jgi:thiamine-phosphate pyrophosphorylase
MRAGSTDRTWDAVRLRDRLREARLYLLFSPAACGGRDPLEVLEAALPHVDLVQVRIKALAAGPEPTGAPSEARGTFEWTEKVLELAALHAELEVPVLVDDRADVARSLLERGCAGVHLGQDDAPARWMRALLGPDPLIGLSTHSLAQVAAALEEPVDYLGFGPIHATSTKGYARGLGGEAAWIAAQASPLPVFPIGGIELANVVELEGAGRAAVSSAILAAADPSRAARELRAALRSAAEGRFED